MFWKNEDLMVDDTNVNDTETLQTDIQRFIAILGFCLMAIFALVQSISVTAARERTEIEDLGHKIESQQAELRRLADENDRLQLLVTDLKPYVTASQSMRESLQQIQALSQHQAEKARSLLNINLKREKDLLALKHALENRDYQIRRLEKEKAQTEKLLSGVQARLRDSKQLQLEIERLKARLAKTGATERELAETRAEKARLERLLLAAQQPQTPPAAPAPAANKKELPRRGRYVAFESDQVFMNLLAADRISLLIKVSGIDKWFRARSTGPGITFSASVPEAAMDPWEVGESQVPSDIISAFRQWTSLADRTEMLVVGLPPEISGPIRSRGNVHGRFIINNSGGVKFNRFEE